MADDIKINAHQAFLHSKTLEKIAISKFGCPDGIYKSKDGLYLYEVKNGKVKAYDVVRVDVDKCNTIEAMQAKSHIYMMLNGFWEFSPGKDIRRENKNLRQLWLGTKLALIHSEVSEALEGLRKDLPDPHLPNRSNFEVELADAVIRIMDICGGLNIDLHGAIQEKLAYNAQRSDHTPGERNKEHGKSF